MNWVLEMGVSDQESRGRHQEHPQEHLVRKSLFSFPFTEFGRLILVLLLIRLKMVTADWKRKTEAKPCWAG